MNMRFDKARHGHSALRVERDGRDQGSRTAVDAHEPPAFYPDVAKIFRAPQSDVFNEDIPYHARDPALNVSTYNLSTMSDDGQSISTGHQFGSPVSLDDRAREHRLWAAAAPIARASP